MKTTKNLSYVKKNIINFEITMIETWRIPRIQELLIAKKRKITLGKLHSIEVCNVQILVFLDRHTRSF